MICSRYYPSDFEARTMVRFRTQRLRLSLSPYISSSPPLFPIPLAPARFIVCEPSLVYDTDHCVCLAPLFGFVGSAGFSSQIDDFVDAARSLEASTSKEQKNALKAINMRASKVAGYTQDKLLCVCVCACACVCMSLTTRYWVFVLFCCFRATSCTAQTSLWRTRVSGPQFVDSRFLFRQTSR